jgi:hypothetical protein
MAEKKNTNKEETIEIEMLKINKRIVNKVNFKLVEKRCR